MNAKSIYDKLVNVEGIPSSILTYSDKNDCIIIEVQDYDKSVFKFAQKFFNGYKSVDIDYTNENKTSVWYNDVSEYSDRETIDSITRFYYDMKVKGLVESKKSARNSIKESRGQTVAELLQNASIKTIVYIYSDSTGDEFEGTNDQLKGEFSRFLYYTVSVWNIGNDKIVNIYCY